MKYIIPKKLTYQEYESLKNCIDIVVVEMKDKIAIEHNNVLTYLKDKERIVIDGNVHKYSYFLYELELDSYTKAQEHLEKLKIKYYKLDELPISDILSAGDYGTWEDDETYIENCDSVQNLLVKELIDGNNIDRLIQVIYSEEKNLYHEFYIQLHDAMISAGYIFHAKTIRNIASNLEHKLNLNYAEEPRKKDISDKISLKVYNPPFTARKTLKPIR